MLIRRTRKSARFLPLLILLSFVTPAVAAAPDAPVTIDWAHEYSQSTQASCGTISLASMENKKSYTLWIKGTKAGTCSFQSKGLTFHYPYNYGSTVEGTTTVFSFARFDKDVVVAWTPGY